jgi:hypothetical protein
MRRRTPLLAGVAVGSLLLLVSLSGGVRGIWITDISVEMDRPDFYLNNSTANATVYVSYMAGPAKDLGDVSFEWWRPDSSLARSVVKTTKDTAQATDQIFLDQEGNWWLNVTYLNVSDWDCLTCGFQNVTFEVRPDSDAVIVYAVDVTLAEDIVEDGDLVEATITLSYWGNVSNLENVSIVWYNETGTPLASSLVYPNGSAVVVIQWPVSELGSGLHIVATYTGLDPVSGLAYFDVVPLRVNTWVNGTISTDTTWGPASGILGACTNVTVEAGVTLTIEPGTTIRFCKGTSLQVDGVLVADGLEGSPINLTTYEHNPQKAAKGDWDGVMFLPSADPGSVLNHVRIEYTANALTVTGGDLAPSNLTITQASGSGIKVESATLRVSDPIITQTYYGIEAIDSDLFLTGGDISSNHHGVVLASSSASITSSTISSNLDTGILGTACSLLLADSDLAGNVNRGIHIERCDNSEVSDTSISGGNYSFKARDGTKLTVVRSVLSDPLARIFDVNNVSGMTVINSTLSSTNRATVHFLLLGSTVTTVNSTFSSDVLTVIGSKLHVKNFLHVFVRTPDGSPVGGAEVTVSVDGVPSSPMTTDAGGWVRWMLLEDRLIEQNGVTDHVISVAVHLDGYTIQGSGRVVDMSSSRTETFTATAESGGFLGGLPQILTDGYWWLLVFLAVMVALVLVGAGVRRRRRETLPEASVEAALQVATMSSLESAELEPGIAYIIPGDSPEPAFKLFADETEKGSPGLCITRSYPHEVRATYSLASPEILWLSRDTKGGGINPTNLGAIAQEVNQFLSEAEGRNPIILLDGVEYLIIQNDFSKVLKLVYSLRDAVSVHGGRLLVPFNLQALDASKWALLTRDLKVLN